MTWLCLEQVKGPNLSSQPRVLTAYRLDGMCTFRVRLRHCVYILPATDCDHSIMSVFKKKVLHIDRNDYYGGFVGPCTTSQDHC